MSKTTKILLIILGVIIIIGISVIVLINRPEKNDSASLSDDKSAINETGHQNTGNDILKVISGRQQQYEEILENKDFIEAFNNFQYSDSEFIDAGLIDDNGILFYMVFKSYDSFEKIDYFYKNKKVQSIWSRTEIFETFNQNLEENFNNNDIIPEQELKDLKFSKYSFISQNKDRYLAVLIRSLPGEKTRIMLVSWNLDL